MVLPLTTLVDPSISGVKVGEEGGVECRLPACMATKFRMLDTATAIVLGIARMLLVRKWFPRRQEKRPDK